MRFNYASTKAFLILSKFYYTLELLEITDTSGGYLDKDSYFFSIMKKEFLEFDDGSGHFNEWH